MPRQARLDVAGALHHIMVRGINKSAIFEDNEDRERFLERLGKTLKEGQSIVYAWVLMNNHVHILFKSGKDGVSAAMRKLLTWYALYYNRRHKRRGHLFDNRYKSILCDEDNYLLALIRYIHLNPVRAGLVTTLGELDHYPWSSHSTIMGKSRYGWMDDAYILKQFGNKKKKARNAYRAFIAEGMSMGKVDEFTGGGLIRSQGGWSQVLAMRRKGQKEESDERILGGEEFVQGILKEAEEKQLRQLKLKREGCNITDIIRDECKKGGISSKELAHGSIRRRVSAIRRTIAHRCREELGLSGAEIARHVGVNTSSINRALSEKERRSGE
ncbi:MAG: transposase [Nitrospirae bacterium]|nr:transposase [Nitrospirota bacterium]